MKNNFCGHIPEKKLCCFDDKLNNTSWKCKCKCKKEVKCKCKCCEKPKEEKYTPYDRCKCKDFKVVYYVPECFVTDKEHDHSDSDSDSDSEQKPIKKTNTRKTVKKYEPKTPFDNKSQHTKQTSGGCGCQKRI